LIHFYKREYFQSVYKLQSKMAYSNNHLRQEKKKTSHAGKEDQGHRDGIQASFKDGKNKQPSQAVEKKNQVLPAFGVDPTIVSLQGYAAARLATESVGKILAAEGPGPTSGGIDIEYQLLEASKAGDLELVKKNVFLHPHRVNCRNPIGYHSTPLHFAAGYNRVGVVEFLLNFGADVHSKDKDGFVPLHNACLLVKHGANANVNVSDWRKLNPLNEAAAKGQYEIVRLLLEYGADASEKNRDGHTPLDLLKGGDQDVVDLLQQYATKEGKHRQQLGVIRRALWGVKL